MGAFANCRGQRKVEKGARVFRAKFNPNSRELKKYVQYLQTSCTESQLFLMEVYAVSHRFVAPGDVFERSPRCLS